MITLSFLLIPGARGLRGYSGYHAGGRNGSSMGYVHPDTAAFIAVAFLLFLAYVAYRVWRSLKKDRTAKQTKKEEEARALRQLYEDNFDDKDATLF
jgi:hypothetical protein